MRTYAGAIRYVDFMEISTLQQGNHIDVSSYSFNELMKELNNA